MVRARIKSTATEDAQPERRTSMSNESNNLSLEQEALVQVRMGELGRIMSKHDDLLREQFQLENYGLLLQYDPAVAKEDQTNEFLRFKDSHDLMRLMPSAGPSRTTRRAQTNRITTLAQLSQHSFTAPITSTPPVTSISAARRVRVPPNPTASVKGKEKEAISVIANGAYASAKARGKRKATNDSLDSERISAGDLESESISSHRHERGKRKAVHDLPKEATRSSRSKSMLMDNMTSNPPVVTSRSTRRSLPHRDTVNSQPTKRRRLMDDSQGLQRRFHITIPPTPPKCPSPSAESRPTTSGKSLPGKTLPENAAPRPIIRRIKLIVRPPPRSISSPRQRPNPALFGHSLPSLLASYVEIDGKGYTAAGLEAAAQRDARILNRVDILKQKGRFLDRKFTVGTTSTTDRSPADLWSYVVSEAIAARNALPKHRFGRGGVLATNVNSKLQVHWELVKKDVEREHAMEERRLRTLAKTILRLVLGEWKKAVFHVREQERLAFEAEEARRGRRHLDAILDQSGQILERQQLELVRTGSTSVDSDEEDEIEVNGEAEEETDIDGSADEGGAEPSEAATEIEEGENDDRLGQGEENYHHYDTPLNDADSDIDTTPSETVPLDVPAFGNQKEPLDEDNVKTILSVDAGNLQETGEREDIVDPDINIQSKDDFALSDMDISSSKTSLESTPFMDEIQLHSDDILPLDLGIGLGPDDFIDPTSDLIDDLQHDTLVSGGGSPIQHQEPLDAASKPSFIKQIGVDDSLRHESHDTAIPVDSSEQPKLNGDKSHSVQAEVDDQRGGKHDVDVDEKSYKADVIMSTDVKGGDEKSPATKTSDDIPVSPIVEDENQVDHQPEASGLKLSATQDTLNAEDETESNPESDWEALPELQPYAVAHVEWEPGSKVTPPLLLRGNLRPYQQSGLEWLASLHNNETNGILADEMGLGKTIQTIALLAHLACHRGIWGPHLIIVPTSVLLNWEMEFKKFLPGFNILSYHGPSKRRKELRQGWNNKYAFNVCVTSYTLASKDQHIFKRKAWYYMILDEAHMIKNFKSQRWNILLMFRSFRRLLLTGTPLQNNLTELWALLRFLMSGTNFANHKEFSDWFGIPLEKAIEMGNVQDQEVQLQVTKLHEMLRPFLLRRMKKDVEKELPSKYDHLVLCRLSKRQRFLYDEFMSRGQTREDLKSGVYQKIANILMQLRKVCNHPDLFEVRPIVTSFAMDKSAIADFEIKELLVRRRLLVNERSSTVDLDVIGLQFTHHCNASIVAAKAARSLEEILTAELIASSPGEPPPHDLRTIEGFRKLDSYRRRLSTFERYHHMSYLNRLRCNRHVLYALETIKAVRQLYNPLTTTCESVLLAEYRPANRFVKSYVARAEQAADVIEKFAFATPAAVARDMPSIVLREMPDDIQDRVPPDFDAILHKPSVKLQIAFPDVSLLQYDCGKLQKLAHLLRERKNGGHRVLIFTQMTRILDILEMFLNFHGYLYLRLDGATKIEDRQYITERFNADPRIFAFIASSRSGGVGINLTGADTVIFYDSDFNPQMDRQCEDRAHRIGQIRDVHIYRFISQYTVEEAMLRKANQKRSLDDLVIQKGEFDWKNFFRPDEEGLPTAAGALQKALVEFEDFEDAEAAKIAAREEALLEGEDRAEFSEGDAMTVETPTVTFAADIETPVNELAEADGAADEEEEEEGGAAIDYMIKFVRSDLDFFREWKLS